MTIVYKGIYVDENTRWRLKGFKDKYKLKTYDKMFNQMLDGYEGEENESRN